MSQHQREIYGNLARLLATENLTVIHDSSLDTASFDAVKRVLSLPVWDGLSDNAYQMLIGHETAHALYSPHLSPDQFTDIPNACIQVVEDARIEKLMKRRYPGMKRTFYDGYKFLYDKDFFDINGQDINTLSFADRVNLHFKIGSFVKINFTKDEQEIVDMVEGVSTFDDTLKVARALYEKCKDMFQQSSSGSGKDNNSKSGKDNNSNESNSKVKVNVNCSSSGNSSSGQTIKLDSSDNKDNKDGESENSEENSDQSSDGKSESDNNQGSSDSNDSKSEANSSGMSGSMSQDTSCKTSSSFEENLKKYVKQGNKVYYVSLPNLNINKIIVPPSILMKLTSDSITHIDISPIISDYVQFKRDSKSEINYLVKEFECKKAADSYSKIQESKSGVLDTLSIHSYKYNDDIFKKNTTVPEGKNHGLIFILDWSGSMENCILRTCQQLFKLIWFCKQVSIPFEVYAFTTAYNRTSSYNKNIQQSRDNTIYISEDTFNLLNFISSKSKTSVLNKQMENLYVLANAVSASCRYNNNILRRSIPASLQLSGTPLNETLISLRKIIPDFIKKNRIQKLNCVILTDGEGCYLNRVDKKSNWVGGISPITSDCYLLDDKLKTTYAFPNAGDTSKYTDVFIRNLKDNYPDVNFIGMRLVTSSNVGSFIRMHTTDRKIQEELSSQFSKHHSCSIKNTEYSSYFGISSSSISNSSTNKFVDLSTCMVSKKRNNKILSEFVSIIA